MKSIGPVNQPVAHDDLLGLPSLILGGATLNTQYNEEPETVPLVDMLRFAMSHGIRAIDTSPYYGDSEKLYGAALKAIEDEFPRDTYYISTKVGRIRLDEFDYSRENVRFSVKRSCERLNTPYLDLVFLHDIEFQAEHQILEALRELRKLKEEGVIKNFGLSGYPVDFLLYVSKKCCEIAEIGPLDAVMSYANLNLQNMTLLKYAAQFKKEAQVKSLWNASILSMSLLRSQETRAFHPCSQELRDAAQQAAEYVQSSGNDLADLATRFAIQQWYNEGPTVLGLSSTSELEHALNNYWAVADRNGQLSEHDEALVTAVQRDVFGTHLNETWESGIPHKMD